MEENKEILDQAIQHCDDMFLNIIILEDSDDRLRDMRWLSDERIMLMKQRHFGRSVHYRLVKHNGNI